MKTRTRSRTEQLHPTYGTESVYTRSGTPVYGASGALLYANGYPVRYPSPPTVTSPTTLLQVELAQNSSVMTDEIDASDRRIHYCDHVVRTTQGVNPRWFWQPTGLNIRTASGGTDWYSKRGRENSTRHAYLAWAAMQKFGVTSVVTPNEASLISAAGVPADRLGMIPARLVSAIDEWHATTTLIEAREFPSLFSLLKRRGPLGGSIAAITKWLQARNDLIRRYRMKNSYDTIRKLLKAYREGQLGYSFGIMPTVNDALTISKVLSKGVKARQTRIVRTVQGKTEMAPSFYSVYSGNEVGTCTLRERVKCMRVDGGIASLKRPAYLNDTFDNAIKRLLGLNGAGLLWEVAPLSFCIDWFLSVDDALDTIYLNSQTEYDVSYWTSVKWDYRRSVTGQEIIDEKYAMVSSQPVPCMREWSEPVWVEHTHYNRVQRESPTPLSSIRFRLGPLQGFLAILIGLGLVKSGTRK